MCSHWCILLRHESSFLQVYRTHLCPQLKVYSRQTIRFLTKDLEFRKRIVIDGRHDTCECHAGVAHYELLAAIRQNIRELAQIGCATELATNWMVSICISRLMGIDY